MLWAESQDHKGDEVYEWVNMGDSEVILQTEYVSAAQQKQVSRLKGHMS